MWGLESSLRVPYGGPWMMMTMTTMMMAYERKKWESEEKMREAGTTEVEDDWLVFTECLFLINALTYINHLPALPPIGCEEENMPFFYELHFRSWTSCLLMLRTCYKYYLLYFYFTIKFTISEPFQEKVWIKSTEYKIFARAIFCYIVVTGYNCLSKHIEYV